MQRMSMIKQTVISDGSNESTAELYVSGYIRPHYTLSLVALAPAASLATLWPYVLVVGDP